MEIKLEEHTCASEGCGVPFWISEAYGERRRSDKKTFYCPNGHSLVYSGETDKAKAIRLANEKAILERNKNNEIDRLQRELKKKCRKPRAKKS